MIESCGATERSYAFSENVSLDDEIQFQPGSRLPIVAADELDVVNAKFSV